MASDTKLDWREIFIAFGISIFTVVVIGVLAVALFIPYGFVVGFDEAESALDSNWALTIVLSLCSVFPAAISAIYLCSRVKNPFANCIAFSCVSTFITGLCYLVPSSSLGSSTAPEEEVSIVVEVLSNAVNIAMPLVVGMYWERLREGTS